MSNNSKILLTGSSGFVGSFLRKSLADKSVNFIGRNAVKLNECDNFFQQDIGPDVDYTAALYGVSVVIHCAARAHIMNDAAVDPLAVYREVNTAGTLNLARQAATAGVRRFIFISSIKVNGESTTGLPAFSVQDNPAPLDPYGISKMEAEAGLRDIAAHTGMETVIIRPPLVYGSGVKANFLSLMKLARMALPLPFGAIRNSRSMVYIGNLVDFIIKSIDHPAAANQTFIISDGRDLSLAELLTVIRLAMGRSSGLFPVPPILFKLVGAVTAKNELVDRLVGSLQVDSSKASDLLGWQPLYTVEQGIQATVASFLEVNK
jgi:nucleoside-diphosphate-sugar epimerase